MKKSVMIALLLLPGLALADGKALHNSACLQCHASLMSGHANQMYQRADKKITSLKALKKRVNACAAAADVNWTKSQKSQVVEYLNQQFYSF